MSNSNPTWMDPLLNKIVAWVGTVLPIRSTINFSSDFSVTDNPSASPPRTDVALAVPGGMPDALFISLVDLVSNQLGVVNAGGNDTVGSAGMFFQPATISGIRFYWVHDSGGARTIKVAVYNLASGGALASATVSVNASGVYTATFSSPLAVSAGINYAFTMYEQSGSRYTHGTAYPGSAQVPAMDFVAAKNFLFTAANWFVSGDARPTSQASGESYPVEPIIV